MSASDFSHPVDARHGGQSIAARSVDSEGIDYTEMFDAAKTLREWLLSDNRPYYALVVGALIDLAREAVDAR